MTIRVRRLLTIAGVLLLSLFAFGIYRAGLDEIPAPPTDTNITAPHGGDAVGERIASRSWNIHYTRMVSNGDQTVVDLYGVHDSTIFKAGKPYLRVRAAHITVNAVTHDFTATGPLEVSTIDSKPERSIKTDSAVWSEAAQRLTFRDRTEIASGASEPMTLGSLTLDVRTGNVEANDASGSIRVK